LCGKLVDQGVFDARLHPAKTLEPLQHGQPLGGGEHVERQIQGALVAGLERVEDPTTSSRLLERMFEL
jgi:hypothetical protein